MIRRAAALRLASRAGGLALALIAGACSSTVQQRSLDAVGEAAPQPGDEVVLPAGADEVPVDGEGAPGGAVGSATRSTTAVRSASGGGGKPSSTHPGVTDSEIRIGVAIANDLDAVGNFGASLASEPSDVAERAVRVVFDDINARGGVAGRKVVPVFQSLAYVTGGDFDRQSQAMCEYFTQDNKVFVVVLAINNHSSLLPTCLNNNDTILLDGGNSTYLDAQEIRPYASTYYRPGGIAFDKWDVYIEGLVRQGMLTVADKIAVVRYDLPRQARVVANVIRPALAVRGLTLAEEFAFSDVTSSAALSQAAAQAGNAVLRFSSRGINRVLFLASQSIAPFTFMAAAENQNYHPRYGVTTADLPDFLATNAPTGQLTGARGIGWALGTDLGPGNYPDSESFGRCVQVMAAGGFPEASFGFGCAPFWFLETVFDRMPALSTGAFRTAVDGLGVQPAYSSGFATRFTPGAAMAGAGYREMAFDDGCTCWRYASPVRPVP